MISYSYSVFARNKLATLPVMLLALAGCGGSTTTRGPTLNENAATLLDSTATDSIEISSKTQSAAGTAITVRQGSIDRETGSLNFGSLSGVLVNDDGEVSLDAGGMATIVLDSGNVYLGRISIEPRGAIPEFGVIGLPTQTQSIPTGSVTYRGEATLTVIDGETIYDLMGQATIQADFENGVVNTDLFDLDGTRTEGINPSQQVNDVVEIRIENASISDAEFSGGDVSFTASTFSSDLSGFENASHEGLFAGPAASEAGAVLSIDDTASGNLLIKGDYLAN